MTLSHARRGGLSRSEPSLDFGYVAFRVLCESFETSRATEGVFALGSLDRKPLLALLREVHDHVADRIEHLSLVRHEAKVAEIPPGPPVGVAEISHLVRCSQLARRGAKCGA